MVFHTNFRVEKKKSSSREIHNTDHRPLKSEGAGVAVKTVNATGSGGTHSSNLSTRETESGGSGVEGQPSLHSESCFREKEVGGGRTRVGLEGGGKNEGDAEGI